jgi:hypothetical protein
MPNPCIAPPPTSVYCLANCKFSGLLASKWFFGVMVYVLCSVIRFIRQRLVTQRWLCGAGPGTIQGRACVTSPPIPFTSPAVSALATSAHISHLPVWHHTHHHLAAGWWLVPGHVMRFKRSVYNMPKTPKTVKTLPNKAGCKLLQDKDLYR